MSSGRDEWMSNWTEEERMRNLYGYIDTLNKIPEEFGGPAKGVTGKQYEQLELDLGYAGQSEAEFDASVVKHTKDWYKTREEATNIIFQANGIIKTVMDSMGNQCGTTDAHEFALWGASELLQKATELLE